MAPAIPFRSYKANDCADVFDLRSRIRLPALNSLPGHDIFKRQATGEDEGGGSGGSNLSGGAIAGIVVGSIAGFLLIMWIVRSCGIWALPEVWGSGRTEPEPYYSPPRHRGRQRRHHRSRHSHSRRPHSRQYDYDYSPSPVRRRSYDGRRARRPSAYYEKSMSPQRPDIVYEPRGRSAY